MTKPFILLLAAFMLCIHFSARCTPSSKAGFHIPDSISEVTIAYKRIDNLILIPMIVNDTIGVNLILDTGCRNMVLFGKRFLKELSIHPGRNFQFSGLGSGKPVDGSLSLGNKVSIGEVLGESIPIVVVTRQGLFKNNMQVDGIIGYDVFIKFEIEFNPVKQTIRFRPATTAQLGNDYLSIPLTVDNARPMLKSSLLFPKQEYREMDLMIDTGSSLGLLLKLNEPYVAGNDMILGRGLNGNIVGRQLVMKKVSISEFEFREVATGIIESPWPNQASLGMEVLRQYTFVINYCKGYFGLQKAPTRAAGFEEGAQKATEALNF